MMTGSTRAGASGVGFCFNTPKLHCKESLRSGDSVVAITLKATVAPKARCVSSSDRCPSFRFVKRYYENLQHKVLLEIGREMGASAYRIAVVESCLRIPDVLTSLQSGWSVACFSRSSSSSFGQVRPPKCCS